jgi:hypothetical protein
MMADNDPIESSVPRYQSRRQNALGGARLQHLVYLLAIEDFLA